MISICFLDLVQSRCQNLNLPHPVQATLKVTCIDRIFCELTNSRVPTRSGNHGKFGKSLKKSSMHGKIMEFEKTLNNHGKIMEFCEII